MRDPVRAHPVGVTCRWAVTGHCDRVSDRYEVRVSGRVGDTVRAEFAELDLETSVEHVQTVVHGEVEDQAALYGLLRRIEALGLDLVGVRRLTGTREVPRHGRTSTVDGQSSSS